MLRLKLIIVLAIVSVGLGCSRQIDVPTQSTSTVLNHELASGSFFVKPEILNQLSKKAGGADSFMSAYLAAYYESNLDRARTLGEADQAYQEYVRTHANSLILPLFKAAGSRLLLEIGYYQKKLTRIFNEWASTLLN